MAIIFLLLHCDHCAYVSRCLAWFLFIEMFFFGGGGSVADSLVHISIRVQVLESQ